MWNEISQTRVRVRTRRHGVLRLHSLTVTAFHSPLERIRITITFVCFLFECVTKINCSQKELIFNEKEIDSIYSVRCFVLTSLQS